MTNNDNPVVLSENEVKQYTLPNAPIHNREVGPGYAKRKNNLRTNTNSSTGHPNYDFYLYDWLESALNYSQTLQQLIGGGGGGSNWTKDANGVWNNTDNIGIGTNTPSWGLEVHESILFENTDPLGHYTKLGVGESATATDFGGPDFTGLSFYSRQSIGVDSFVILGGDPFGNNTLGHLFISQDPTSIVALDINSSSSGVLVIDNINSRTSSANWSGTQQSLSFVDAITQHNSSFAVNGTAVETSVFENIFSRSYSLSSNELGVVEQLSNPTDNYLLEFEKNNLFAYQIERLTDLNTGTEALFEMRVGTGTHGLFFQALTQPGIDSHLGIRPEAIYMKVPTFADNAAALAGNLVQNDVYKTITGELRIVV